MSSFLCDDELPPAISSTAGAGRKRKAERVRVVAHHNKEAPLEQQRQQVLLEVMDTSPSAAERSGLDLVAVLDVSMSMAGENIEKLKTAMKFVIGKLSPMDRLSIVSFSDEAEKRCGLLCTAWPASREKLNDIVENGLKPDRTTNMRAGLETGLDVLARRRHRVGRIGSIILMSDGVQNEGGNAEDVMIVDNVAVYTFAFGAGEFARVLEIIASKSQGGTLYFMKEGESVSEHFSQIMAGLLSVVVRDLKLTVWEQPGHSTIDEYDVDAGSYQLVRNAPEDGDRTWRSVTVNFGDLYCGEVRKVIVNLLLPAIHREYRDTAFLFAKCSYSIQGKDMQSPPGGDYLRCVMMRRTRTAMSPDVVRPEVKAEQVRRDHAKTLWKVIQIEDMDRAKSKLEEAKRDLDAEQQQSSSSSIVTTMISILRDELNLFLRMATWAELLACLLAAWTSHNRQRFAARGDVRSVRIFVTHLMATLKQQAIKFEENPNMQLSSVEEDMKEEEEAMAKPVVIHTQFPYPQPLPIIRRNTTKIQRIGASLRGILNGKPPLNIVTPVVVAIGPYHHGLSELQEMEEAKHAAVEEFCNVAKLPREAVLEKINPVAASARSCYTGGIGSMDDQDFAELMLLDGCFLLQFMAAMCPDRPNSRRNGKKNGLMVEVHTHIDDISRDIMLLENQIPWSVLEVLMELRPKPEAVPIGRFLDLMASVFGIGKHRGNNPSDLHHGRQGQTEPRHDHLSAPGHLLDLLYHRQMGADRTQEHFIPKMSTLSSTAVELAEMGVKLTASKIKEFGDMSIKKRKWLGLFGELSLAPLILNDVTGCWLINMAAYEACLGATKADNFAVSSYISIIALLMNREEDVQELRSKRIVHSAFSNQETLVFFKWAARHMRVGHRYYQVFQQLQEYRDERYVWIAFHRFFYNNYKMVATLLSIAGVLAGLFKTILSLKQ